MNYFSYYFKLARPPCKYLKPECNGNFTLLVLCIEKLGDRQNGGGLLCDSLPFGGSYLHSHPSGGSPHLLKNSWPVVPLCPGRELPFELVKILIFFLHFFHLKSINEYFNRTSFSRSFSKIF